MKKFFLCFSVCFILTGCSPSTHLNHDGMSSNASSFNELVNKNEMQEPFSNHNLEPVYGDIKKILSKYKNYYFDKKRRLTEVSDKHSKYMYTYNDDSMFPAKQVHIRSMSTDPVIGTSTYQRDHYGNIISYTYHSTYDNETKYNDYQESFRKKDGFYIRDIDSELLGKIQRFFKNGVLVKELSQNSPGFSVNFSKKKLRKTTIDSSEDRYDYKYHDNGRVFEIQTLRFQDGELHQKDIMKYSNEGFKIYQFQSRFGNTNIGKVTLWKHYDLDKAQNWISRKRCEIVSSDGKQKCTEEVRKITYY